MNNGYLLIFYTFCSFVRSFVEFELSVSKFLWRFVQNSFHFWKLRVKNSLHAFTFAVEKYCHSHPSGARIQFVGYFTQFVVMFIVWLNENIRICRKCRWIIATVFSLNCVYSVYAFEIGWAISEIRTYEKSFVFGTAGNIDPTFYWFFQIFHKSMLSVRYWVKSETKVSIWVWSCQCTNIKSSTSIWIVYWKRRKKGQSESSKKERKEMLLLGKVLRKIYSCSMSKSCMYALASNTHPWFQNGCMSHIFLI